MTEAQLRALMAIHAWTPPAVIPMTASDAQHLRSQLTRALSASELIKPARLRMVIRTALFTAAAELGCCVCGKPIKVEELRTNLTTRKSLVHLWGTCSQRLAEQLDMTQEEIFGGEAWQ